MRLFNIREHRFEQFFQNIPPYAILSHRWAENEPSIAEIENGSTESIRTGLNKVYAFARYVSEHFDYIDWIWVDSCCIRQTDSAELSLGVNSMFSWYRNARVCIAYLADVKDTATLDQLRRSQWFTRGWTLQELLASTILLFVTEQWQVIGHKGVPDNIHRGFDIGPSLESTIADVCNIPRDVIHDFKNAHLIKDDEKLKWMEGRETLLEEDKSYALFGIFGVSPGANYGEKFDGARRRLLRAIQDKEDGLPSDKTSLIHVMPYPRDPGFVDRPEMQELQDKLTRPGANIAIEGLGGVGKTQLAIECCYRVMEKGDRHILWLHASSAERLDLEIARMTQDLNIPGAFNSDADAHQLLRTWLLDSSRRWLVVLDNADQAEHLLEAAGNQGRTRRQCIPYCPNGQTLLTSRQAAVAKRMVDEHSVLTLQPDTKHAVQLLKRRLEQTASEPSLVSLALKLGSISLAISQAAAYINTRRPQCTVDDYLVQISKSDKTLVKMLSNATQELRRDVREAKNSIMLTWQISFDHLYATRRSAADLLAMMSLLDPQSIPRSLLQPLQQPRAIEEVDTVDDDDVSDPMHDFELDVTALKDYSFITEIADMSSLRMHRLVHVAAQAWLSTKEDITRWQSDCLRRLMVHTPERVWFSQHHMASLRFMIPHASCIQDWELAQREDRLQQAAVLAAAAASSFTCGLPQAEELCKRALNIRTADLGEDHQLTLACLPMLATICHNTGRHDEAEQLQLRCVAGRSRTLPEGHVERIESERELATGYAEQGQWKRAHDMLVPLLALCQAYQGKRNPSTILIMADLGRACHYQARLNEAEALLSTALETCRIVYGPRHPYTSVIMSDLSMTYLVSGWLNGALAMSTVAVECVREQLGEISTLTLRHELDLVNVLIGCGRFSEAEALSRAVLEKAIALSGERHILVIRSREFLSLSQARAGKCDEAMRNHKLVVKAMEGAHGDRVIAKSIQSMADAMELRGDQLTILDLRKQAVEMTEAIEGVQATETIWQLCKLAFTHLKLLQHDEALKIYERCRQNEDSINGIDTALSAAALGHYHKLREMLFPAQILLQDVDEAQTTITVLSSDNERAPSPPRALRSKRRRRQSSSEPAVVKVRKSRRLEAGKNGAQRSARR